MATLSVTLSNSSPYTLTTARIKVYSCTTYNTINSTSTLLLNSEVNFNTTTSITVSSVTGYPGIIIEVLYNGSYCGCVFTDSGLNSPWASSQNRTYTLSMVYGPGQIATESEAASIGGSNNSLVVTNKMCTKIRSTTFGCAIMGNYINEQLILLNDITQTTSNVFTLYFVNNLRTYIVISFNFDVYDASTNTRICKMQGGGSFPYQSIRRISKNISSSILSHKFIIKNLYVELESSGESGYLNHYPTIELSNSGPDASSTSYNVTFSDCINIELSDTYSELISNNSWAIYLNELPTL